MRNMSPTQRATRCTSASSRLLPGALRYTLVFETMSRRVLIASGVLNESQSALRKASWAVWRLQSGHGGNGARMSQSSQKKVKHNVADQQNSQQAIAPRRGSETLSHLSVSSRSACWKRFFPSNFGPSASACDTRALTVVKKFCTPQFSRVRLRLRSVVAGATRTRGFEQARAPTLEEGAVAAEGMRWNTYVECNLDSAHFSRHERLGEVHLGVPQLCQERQPQLARGILLEDFLLVARPLARKK